ncbi:NAD(+) synthase [Sediminitomix flava]|uniref:Glutamine-dependent NAD(+) synthetase n=1 Tax=Sediminitomix flava TaxID=379075 RepID=A0A315ZGK6_SEDFL|nr:NAD(+) synthase [Sediminitomix flava]PWJ44260.1 NAD+ synthase (glutamine-hydrolysing) [Sediminitomix flava]
MNWIKIAGAELNQIPLDWDNNKKNIIKAIEDAKDDNVAVLCLPELTITGYGCEDTFFSEALHETTMEVLFEIVPHTKDIVVAIGLPVSYQNRVFNAAALLVDGELIGFTAKQFLPKEGIHYEARWFSPWPQGVVEEVQFRYPSLPKHAKKKAFPIGDIHFDLNGIKIGFEICEDAWVADRPGRSLSRMGVDIILNPSASHFAFQKFASRKRFVVDGSRAFGCAYVYSNLLGNESGRSIFDGGTLIASSGRLLAMSERLGFHDVKVTSTVVDLNRAHLAQMQMSSDYSGPEKAAGRIEVDYQIPSAGPTTDQPLEANWESSKYLKEEEFARAEALALFDYMRKSYSKGFVVSLSGGADSSAIVSCIYLMVKLGIEKLGLKGFKKKLAYFKSIQNLSSVEEMMPEFLTTAYQPTENSGEVTLNAAKGLAEGIGAEFFILNVNDIFKNYVGMIEESIDRQLTWEQDDLALQNIQARVRAPSVWMLANIKGGLLLSTSNRSEAAVGYATMDGDTSGGLSPLAGIDKTFLRSWLKWLEKVGIRGEIKIPSLGAVNDQQPTAELRPKGSKQTDEADLMPYEVLNEIEGLAIRDKKSPVKCFYQLNVIYPEVEKEQLVAWIEKFFTMWCRNQWKRERYAASFHLDDRNLDPKTWCRFPILSGGYKRELEELRRLIK